MSKNQQTPSPKAAQKTLFHHSNAVVVQSASGAAITYYIRYTRSIAGA